MDRVQRKIMGLALVGLLVLVFSLPAAAFASEGDLVATTPVKAKSIAKAKISAIEKQVYTGSPLTPSATVTLSGKTLTEGVDYTLVYENNVEIGTATVRAVAIEGSGYTGQSKTKNFSIVKNRLVVEQHGNDITFSEEGTGWINMKSELRSFTNGSYALLGGKKKDTQVVTFKPGTYIIPRLALGSYVTVKAKGAKLRSMSSGGFYVAGQTGKKKGGYKHVTNVTVDGGQYLTYKSNHLGTIMKFSHGKNIKLRNFSINNCYGTHFIEFVGICNSTITNVKLTGKYVGTPDNEAIQLDNAFDAHVAPSCEPFDGTPTKNVTIKNCTIKVPTMPYGIGTNTVHKKLATNLKILNCNITAKTNAIELTYSKNCLIKNCTFHKTDIKRNETMINMKEVGNKLLAK